LATPRKIATPPMNEAETIDRAKLGDAECFKSLYDHHKRRVYGLCLRMTGDTDAAEDLTQEAFLLLHRKITSFRGESSFFTWLHRLTVNIVLMHVRKRRFPEISLDESMDADEEEGTPMDYGTEDLRLAGSIDRVTLERAIENLPPHYRVVTVLHDIEGFGHGEIAEKLGCSIGVIKSQLYKARMRLRSELLGTRTRPKAPCGIAVLPSATITIERRATA